MSDKPYDILAEKAQIFIERFGDAYEKAAPKQRDGEFTLSC